MDMTNDIVWLTIALASITVVITKAKRKTAKLDPKCIRMPPPAVKGLSIIRILHTLLTKGLQQMIHDQYKKLGSVFTVRFFRMKATFLIGPEVSAHFYQGTDYEISNGVGLEFTVPMLGKEVGYGVDSATRNEQFRVFYDVLKPSKLRSHYGSILQEVEEYFEKWGHQGIVDLKQELNQLLMLISGRCLLGKQVREKMLDEFFTLFQELTDNGMCLTSIFFPYVPTPATRRRDIARAKLSEMLTEIVRSRKEYSHVENDVLQNFIDFKYSDGRSTTESEVIGLMITLILAGKHTSTITSIWTGAHLLASARILKSVLVEQKILISKYGDHLDYNAFLEMDTLHNCIKETLRIHPPVAIFRRKVHKNFIVQTKDGIEYEIHSGHTLVSPVIFNNNLPHIYKDPDVYDPDRFGPGREEDRVGGKFAYTSFSGGRHACKGESFAYLQIKVIWSYLLRNFELKLESPFPDPDWTKLVAEPKGRVMVSYKKRLLATTEVVHA